MAIAGDAAAAAGPGRARVLRSVSAAAFYMGVSIALTLLNKALFATFAFDGPRLLGLGQFVAALVFLRLFDGLGLIQLPPLNALTVQRIWPLTASYLVMVVCGFGAMLGTNLVMFGTLRRTGIVIVLIMEYLLLNNRPSAMVIVSTVIMVVGVLTAGVADLDYDPIGYIFAFLANVSTAAYVVLIKYYKNTLKLDAFGMLMYNAILSTPILFLISWISGDFEAVANYEGASSPAFWIVFLTSCSMGFVINWSVFLNTSVNSPLTQTVTGQLKDILVLVFGVLMFNDTHFSLLNAVGVTVAMLGSFVYAFVKYSEMRPAKGYMKVANSDPVAVVVKQEPDDEPVDNPTS